MRTHLFRSLLAILMVALGLVVPAAAQSTGMVKGKVVDAKGEPIEGAKIVIEYTEGVNRKNETKTNKKGEFIQIGLFPGTYRVTASKEKVGQQSFETRVRIGNASEINFQLSPESGLTDKDKQKNDAIEATFQAGIDASRPGQHDPAIAKFTEAAALIQRREISPMELTQASIERAQRRLGRPRPHRLSGVSVFHMYHRRGLRQ